MANQFSIINQMNCFLLLKGLILGFSIAAPVGPIGLLCINKTIKNGKLSGFLSGMGAASADLLYGCIAAFGLTLISNFLIKEAFWIKFFGGLFLCYLGLKIFLSKKNNKNINSDSKNLFEDYLSTFFLTITNPMTILSFTAIFAGLGIATNNSLLNSSVLVTGIFFGSALWWLFLSYGVAFITEKTNKNFLILINNISGLIIFCFGIFALINI